MKRWNRTDKLGATAQDATTVMVELAALEASGDAVNGPQDPDRLGGHIPTETMAWLLNAAALGRNNCDAARLNRRDNAHRTKIRKNQGAERPDDFRRKALAEFREKLPDIETEE